MERNPSDLQLLNLAEAALLLQISKRTLLRTIQQKEVAAFKVGGQWRIRESLLRQWIRSKEFEAEGPGRGEGLG
jgi:excisionase family DNA binding protein